MEDVAVGDIVSGVASVIMILFMIAFGAFFYLIPTIVAFAREHPHRVALFWLNLLLGWSGLVWVGVLIWAIAIPVEDEKRSGYRSPSVADAPRRQIMRRSDPLTDRGHPLV